MKMENVTSDGLPVHYNFVQCTGVEKRLIDCSHGASPSAHEKCKGSVKFRYAAASCSKGIHFEKLYCSAA